MADIAWITFCFIVVTSNVAPLCWQIKHNNSGAVSLGIWVFVANLDNLINAIVWRDDAVDRAPIYCDISIKIQAGATVGILAAVICILRLLSRALSPQPKLSTRRQRISRAALDYLFSFGLPAFVMIMQILWKPFRYGITNHQGCTSPILNVWPVWAFYILYAPILSVVGCLLSGYVGYRLYVHRRNFKKLVSNSDSALTVSRFIRLGLLSLAIFIVSVPFTFYQLVVSIRALGPYRALNWRELRSFRNFVAYDVIGGNAPIQQWSLVIVGMLVTVFFGFGNEAMSFYTKPLRLCGFQKHSEDEVTPKSVFVSHITLTRQDAMRSKNEALDDLDFGSSVTERSPYSGPFSSGISHSTQQPREVDLERDGGSKQ